MVRGSPAVRSRPAVLGLCVMVGLWPFGPVSASLCLLDGHLGLPTPTPPSNHLCPSVLRRSLLLPAPLALCLLCFNGRPAWELGRQEKLVVFFSQIPPCTGLLSGAASLHSYIPPSSAPAFGGFWQSPVT